MKSTGENEPKVLVIDDDADIRVAVKTTLESKGYEVVTADNRASGMEAAKSERPDLIILDVMMESRHDGFEMARELKKNPKCKDMPILMFTSIKEKSGTDFKSAAGDPSWLPVDGFLDKPVEPKILVGEVEKLLAKQ